MTAAFGQLSRSQRSSKHGGLPQVCEARQEIPQPSSQSCWTAAFLLAMAILIAGIRFPEMNAPTGSTVAAPLGVIRPFRAIDFYYDCLSSDAGRAATPSPSRTAACGRINSCRLSERMAQICTEKNALDYPAHRAS